jgi:hypothetical protein
MKKPTTENSTSPLVPIVPASAREALFLQYAQAYYQDMQAVGNNAPFGQVFNQIDAFAFQHTRELGKKSLELVLEDQIENIEKTKMEESRACEHCQTKKRHRGRPGKKFLSTQGEITLKRLYWECVPCRLPEHPVDAILGLESGYSVGARRLIVFAGTSWSFGKAATYLEEFCGLKISENTIRKLCQEESPKMEQWQNNAVASHQPFRQAEGKIEFTADGTCVNTTEGWKEMRIGIFSLRMPGGFAFPWQWASRHLPKPHVSLAFAGIADKDTFRRQWGYWLNRLGIADPGVISALADGAQWIWDAIFLEFSGKAQENLDIYHALEYLSNKGEALFGKGTAEYTWWYNTIKSDLLEGGVAPLLDRVRTMAQMEQLDKNKETLRVLENYLVFHSGRMNYRQRLAEGLSIGSGQVEGACKNLIGARLKQTGAKWRRDRVDRMAKLCAVLYGEQWKDYWNSAV